MNWRKLGIIFNIYKAFIFTVNKCDIIYYIFQFCVKSFTAYDIKEVVCLKKRTKKLVACLSALSVMMSFVAPAYAQVADEDISSAAEEALCDENPAAADEEGDVPDIVSADETEADDTSSADDIIEDTGEDVTADDSVSEEETDIPGEMTDDAQPEDTPDETSAEEIRDDIPDAPPPADAAADESSVSTTDEDTSEPSDMTLEEAYRISAAIDAGDGDSFEPYGVEITEEQAEAISRIIYYDETGMEELPDDSAEERIETARSVHYKAYANGSSDFYYNQMSDAEKNIYNQLTAACEDFISNNTDYTDPSYAFAAIRFDDTPLSMENGYKVFWAFYYSNPQYFFLENRFGYYHTTSNTITGLILNCYDNCQSHTDRQSINTAIKTKTDSWISQSLAFSTPVEQERFLAQTIASNVEYIGAEYNQSMMGSVYLGKSVCMGYAFAMEYLCNRIGVESFVLSSAAYKGDPEAHAWNAVKFGDDWYLADVTFCDQGSYFYDAYLNKSKATFRANDGYNDSHPWYNYQFDYDTLFTMPVFDKDDPSWTDPWYTFDDQTGTLTLAEQLPDTSYNRGLADIANIDKDDIKKIVISSSAKAGQSLCGAFGGLTSLESIEGLANLDISGTSDMSYMLRDCTSLTSLDLTGVTIGSTINRQGFFSGCTALTSLTLPAGMAIIADMDLANNSGDYLGWAVTGSMKVISGSGSYASFTSTGGGYVRVPKWYTWNSSTYTLTLTGQLPDTSDGEDFATLAGVNKTNVKKIVIDSAKAGTSLDSAFAGMTNLEGIDGLAQLDTTSVTDMDNTFCNCSLLTSLDLSSFGITSASYKQDMFAGCTSLTSLVLSAGTVISADMCLVNKDTTFRGWAESGTDTVISGEGAYASFTAVTGGKYIRIRDITYTKNDAVPASCTSTGIIEYYTGSDGNFYVLTDGEYIQVAPADIIEPIKPHTKGGDVVENYRAPTYESNGSLDNVRYCTVCGAEIERKTVTIPKLVLDKPVFRATAGNGTVTLSWNDVEDATAYRVYRYENNAFKYLKEITATTYNDSGLANGTRYGYLVRAFHGGAGSPYTNSDIIYATPVSPVTSLNKPVLTVTAGNGYATLRWNAVSNAVSYRVYRYDNGTYTALVNTSGTAYTASNLTNGKKVGFLVRAFNGNIGSPFTVADVVYTTPFGALAKPVVTAAAGSGQVTVKWNAVSGAASYRVYRYVNNQYIYLKEITGTSYTDTGLANGTKYGYLVRAFNGSTGSAYTTADIVYATPFGSLAKPVVKATAGNASVTLKWNAVANAEKYRVYRYENGTYTALVNTTATTYTVTNLANGKKVGFLVRAINGSIGSAFTASDVVYSTPISAASVSKPSVTATAGNGKVTLRWSAVSGATSYRIYIYYKETNSYQYLLETPLVGWCDVTQLQNGRSYGFLIRAFKENTGSPYTSADIVYATPHA